MLLLNCSFPMSFKILCTLTLLETLSLMTESVCSRLYRGKLVFHALDFCHKISFVSVNLPEIQFSPYDFKDVCCPGPLKISMTFSFDVSVYIALILKRLTSKIVAYTRLCFCHQVCLKLDVYTTCYKAWFPTSNASGSAAFPDQIICLCSGLKLS